MKCHYAITGCSGGIGAALTAHLRAQGHKVTGFDHQKPEAAIDECVRLDLNDPSQISAAVEAVSGHFDGLCNNAGIPPRNGWEERILQVNFLSQRQFTSAILPKLRDGSTIVNMASRAGRFWRDQIDQIKHLAAVKNTTELQAFIKNEKIDPTRAYKLSKEAMIAWTIAETEALKSRGIGVNALSPARFRHKSWTTSPRPSAIG